MAISEHQKPIETGLGPRPEPDDILQGVNLSGKTAVVTGGYSGIGLETVKALAGAGARVIAPARSKAKAEAALSELDGDIRTAVMDLADLQSIDSFAEDCLAAADAIDILVNNAGIMACPEARTGKNWESQFAVNHIGHFALFRRLAPALRRADGARVVALSSTAHKRSPIRFDDVHFDREPYEKWAAYGQSKTANALFAVGVDQRFRDDGVRAFAVHPGGILTPLQRHLEKTEMVALGWIDESGDVSEMARPYFKTPAQGATTTLWCATSRTLDDLGGLYCEDCNIAAVDDGGFNRAKNVQPYAVDDEYAERLWVMSAQMIDGC